MSGTVSFFWQKTPEKIPRRTDAEPQSTEEPAEGQRREPDERKEAVTLRHFSPSRHQQIKCPHKKRE